MSRNRRSRRRERKGRVLPVIAAILAVALGAVGVIALRQTDSRRIVYDAQTLAREADVLSDVVDVMGVKCVPKRNIRSYLVMGIDDTASEGDGYVTAGQCDVVVLLVVDHTTNTYQYLPINRSTICDIHWYDMYGEDMGISTTQLAFAHTVGNGGALSCENVVDAVSNLMGGVDIQSYIAVNLTSVATINQVVDGVTLTIEDDFSGIDPTLVQGETITLNDKQAEHYIRARHGMKDSTNAARMRRQLTFIDAVKEKMLVKTREDGEYPMEVYNTLLPEMVTNMNGKAFSRLINGLTQCRQLPTLEINGLTGVDDFGFEKFDADQESVRDATIALFYRVADEENTGEGLTDE